MIAAFSVLTAVTPSAVADPGVTDSEILIGMVNAQTGSNAKRGVSVRAGVEAAFQVVNAKGGVLGRKLKLAVADDAYTAEKTIDATLKLAEEGHVFAFTGFVGTSTAVAALPILKDMKIPAVGIFSGAMELREPMTPTVFNIRANYDEEPEALVNSLTKNGAKKIAVFYQDDSFGRSVLAGVTKSLGKRGLTLAGKGSFVRNTTDVQTGLAAMIKADPDAVLMVGPYAPITEFVKQARKNNLKAKLATLSSVDTETFVKAVGADGEGIVISQVVPNPSADAAIVKEAKSAIPEANWGYVSLESYINAMTLAKGLESAGKDLTREGLIKALENMKGADLGGFSLTFGPTSRQGSHAVYQVVIKGGTAVPVN